MIAALEEDDQQGRWESRWSLDGGSMYSRRDEVSLSPGSRALFHDLNIVEKAMAASQADRIEKLTAAGINCQLAYFYGVGCTITPYFKLG